MEDRLVADKIQIRRDTAANWTSSNPTLAQGELGLETDTSKLKAGTGSTAWTSLGYYDLGTLGYLPSTNPVVTGSIKATTYQETYVANATGATTTLDLATGTNFSVTLSENTTFVFSNPPASGTAFAFTLVITQPASAKTIAWPASVDWAAATAPDAPGNSEVNAYGFMTRDGGTTYYGFLGGAAFG